MARLISKTFEKETQSVYDLTTETSNFFANGILVHNCGK
jgi:intein/homing endonuclease